MTPPPPCLKRGGMGVRVGGWVSRLMVDGEWLRDDYHSFAAVSQAEQSDGARVRMEWHSRRLAYLYACRNSTCLVDLADFGRPSSRKVGSQRQMVRTFIRSYPINLTDANTSLVLEGSE
jgi:hypothetical protein